MPGVAGGEAFSNKHVAQVAAATGTLDLRPHTVGVGQLVYGSRNLLIE